MPRITGGSLALLSWLLPLANAAGQEPPPAPEPTVEAPLAAQDLADYRIGANDVLAVDVFGVKDFTRTVRVLRDGTISLPLLGNFSVQGLKLDEAEQLIADMLRQGQFVRDPQVTIFVEEYVSRGVSIQGAVDRPGVYQMLGQRTLLEMVGMAGGLLGKEGERAGATILVLRQPGDGMQARIEIDTRRLVELGDVSQNIYLEPGDIVMVPHDQKLTIYVSGAVADPGAVEFSSSEGISVLQAITAAGGPTPRARLGKVTVIRLRPDGSEERFLVNLKAIRKGNAESVRLENNDTIVVEEFGF